MGASGVRERMQGFVGTSGWSYSWNQKKSLAWFVDHAHLNAIELNGSFYRFPRREHVESWARIGSSLRWAVKVHQIITHRYLFNARALETWERFRELFTPLEDRIDFFLFQAPPRFADIDRMITFIQHIDLGNRCALEIRNRELLGRDDLMGRVQEHAVIVSVDSPHYRNRIFAGEIVYLRMHGREKWYTHDYTAGELQETAEKIRSVGPERAYVFFNNNHNMLKNARAMLDLLK